jgi:Protein of unknown function (DUF1579)
LLKYRRHTRTEDTTMTKVNEPQARSEMRSPGGHHRQLDRFIGKWITQGETAADENAPALPIVASDVYEWMPGGFFVLHTAHGRIGDTPVGGTEIIGYDEAGGRYWTRFFDSGGHETASDLTVEDGTWTWQGETTRCTARVSSDGSALVARHERSPDGATWVPSMDVTLRKVA